MQAIAFALYRGIFSKSDIILVCSDSLSSIKSLTNLYKESSVLHKIRHYLNILSAKGKSVRFIWTPSHTGIKGNELADQAAKEASLAPIPQINVWEKCDIKRWLRNLAIEEWEALWQETPLETKLRRIKRTTKPWKSSIRGVRREEVVLTRLRIGHTLLTHGYLMTRDIPPRCPQCDVIITVQHVLEECPQYETAFSARGISRRLEDCLSDDNSKVNALILLLKEIGIFNLI